MILLKLLAALGFSLVFFPLLAVLYLSLIPGFVMDLYFLPHLVNPKKVEMRRSWPG